MSRAPITQAMADFVSELDASRVPPEVRRYTETLIRDAVGTLAAATHPRVSAGARLAEFALSQGGPTEATLIGRGAKVGVVNAALHNATLGYACDMEPHHPEAILHPIAVMLPTALALAERERRAGADLVTAVALGCEITYRVSMAMDPKALYALGFHPSAVCGTFGAATAAAHLLALDVGQTVRTLGLAALQASGLMAWEDDPNEDARPFQMGMAARNGITAALLAKSGMGAPDRIFDGGHDVLRAFSRAPSPEPLTDRLGERWDGVLELAIKPYSCVAFLHPALDALASLTHEHSLRSEDVEAITLRFAESGSHCVDGNPLKSHCAQYVLPVALARGGLHFLDLFDDRREADPEIARLARATTVVRDRGELEALFPDFYAGEITLGLRDGRTVAARSDIARGYPESPLPELELHEKFDDLVSTVASPERRERLAEAAGAVGGSASVDPLAELLATPPAG